MEYSACELFRINRISRHVEPSELVQTSVQSLGINRSNIDVSNKVREKYVRKRNRKTHRGQRSRFKRDNNRTKNQVIKTKQKTADFLKFCVINAQSSRNKANVINEFISDNSIHLTAITETWLKPDDHQISIELTPNGYDIIHIPRVGKRGGGVALIAESRFKGRKRKHPKYDTFECVTVHYELKHSKLLVASIYRPPEKPISEFLNDFQSFLEDINDFPGEIILSGDFNIHIEDKNHVQAVRFLDLLDCFGLTQHVDVPTHTSNHVLDLIITRSETMRPSSPPSIHTLLSDHFAVFGYFTVAKRPYETKQLSLRKLTDIDSALFRQDISNLQCISDPPSDIDELVDQFDSQLRSVLDKHAPKTTKTVKVRPKNAWIDSDIIKAKHEKRRTERKWLKSRSASDKHLFQSARNRYNAILDSKKVQYFSAKIKECGTDQKALFRTMNVIQRKQKSQVLPAHTNEGDLANQFATYFKEKIDKISDSFPRTDIELDISSSSDAKSTIPEFTQFRAVTIEDITAHVKRAPNKYCPQVDAIPTSLMKEHIDILAPTIALIVNKSLEKGQMPTAYKEAIVTPLIKKTDLDPDFSNFRPVSNLPFVSKLIERVLSDQCLYG